MGVFKFRVPAYWQLEPQHARTVHLTGLDGVPRPCSVTLADQLLTITRNQNESARTYIAYPLEEFGELTICTGTLLESDQPYELGVELARGTLNRLRNQTSIWCEGGLEIPAAVRELTASAIEHLGSAIVNGDNEANEFPARQALQIAMQAMFLLCDQFGDKISEFRVTQTGIPSFWQAATITDNSTDPATLAPFDLVQSQCQPSSEQPAEFENDNLRSIVGPVLDCSPRSKFSTEPADFQTGREALLTRLDQLLVDIPDGASLIHATCNLNGIGQRNLSYRQQLQLTGEILGRIENSECDVPAMVSFDYPWAERLAWSVGGISPMQIAEDLMRNGARIAFIGLDINLDYWPGGSLARDPLQWIELIDTWCQLGLPLVLCLRVPKLEHSMNPDTPNQRSQDSSDSPSDTDGQDSTKSRSKSNQVTGHMSDSQRWRLVQLILKIAVARPGVHGVIWRQWSDAEDDRYPGGGMVDAAGNPKSTLDWLARFKQQTLKR